MEKSNIVSSAIPMKIQPNNKKWNVETRTNLIKALKRIAGEMDISNFSASNRSLYMQLTGKREKTEDLLVIPISPKLQTYKRSELRNEKIVPTEEVVISEITQGKLKLKKKLKENQKYYKKALEGSLLEIKSDKPPTMHDNITLRTEERQKLYKNYMKEKEERLKAVEIMKQAEITKRKRSITKTPIKILKLTNPLPFDFASERRLKKIEESGQDFISLKEQLNNFYSQRSVFQSETKYNMMQRPTCPKAPNFQLDKRLIESKQKSSEEMEIEEIQNYPKFKAQDRKSVV